MTDVPLFAWSFGVAATSLWATRPTRDTRRAAPPEPARDPVRVLVVRPCAGREAGLHAALASTLRVARPRGFSVRFAVATREDPALPEAAEAADALRAASVDAEVVVTDASAPNQKADQIARVLEREPASDVVVIADSDVLFAGPELDALLHSLDDRTVGASWLAPVEIAPTTLADRASAAVLDTSLHAFSLLSQLDVHCMVGKLVAVKTPALRDAGGFGPLARVLGEDMDLARRLRALGFRTVRGPGHARSVAGGRRAGEVIARFARWIAVIRAQRPALLASYPLLLAATPLLVAASGGLALHEGVRALYAGGLAIGARIGVAWVARRRSGRPWTLGGIALDACLADALLLAAFARAMRARRVVWRGASLRVTAEGVLEVAAADARGVARTGLAHHSIVRNGSRLSPIDLEEIHERALQHEGSRPRRTQRPHQE